MRFRESSSIAMNSSIYSNTVSQGKVLGPLVEDVKLKQPMASSKKYAMDLLGTKSEPMSSLTKRQIKTTAITLKGEQ